jgi:hypothetical protein
MVNARRGVAPVKMTLLDWQTAESDHEGSNEEVVPPCKIAFMKGKGIHRVSVIIPNDCLPAIRELVELRSAVGINRENVYLFPKCNGYLGHVKSRRAIDEVCQATGSRLTSTDFNHRTFALHAIKDLPEDEKRKCYKHMGRSLQDN